ncbi:MAG: FtsW/RodA/SpoVE family cell cycle protein [Clostridiales bacterium]|nr:FtsW/RodA/SpoVE family cell cycle protein [Clostridiales bacterium]
MSALRDLVLDALKQADHILLSLCVAANLFGIVLIYSATRYRASLHSSAAKQAIAMCIGIVLYFVVSQLDLEMICSKWKWLLAGATIFLLLLIPLGTGDDMGNRAWISLPLIPFTLQPAEMDKIVFTILFAQLISYIKEKKRMNNIVSVMLFCAALLYFVGLIYVISSDAGTCLIYVAIFAVMLWVGGLHPLWFAAGFAVIGFAGYKLWGYLPEENYLKKRILCCLDHDYDPLGAGFQQSRSLLAIRSGGLTGQGYMQGAMTQSTINNKLSQRFNDFIFSSCCEEWGLLGALLVIGILTAIILRCIYVGVTAPDTVSSLMCIGFAGMLIAQVGINIGMCLYILPTIGLTLPFFSLGGTSIITNYVIMGLVSGVKHRNKPDWLKNTATPEPTSGTARKSVLFVPGGR